MPHDVFISYSSRDKAVAHAVCAALENRRVRCWYAPRDVPAGQPWPGHLMKAIGESRVFVLVLSKGSNNSKQVLRELGEAANKGIAIIPFRIDDVQPSEDMGYFINTVHWLDALTPPLKKHLEKLVDTVEKLLPDRVIPPPPPPPPPPVHARPAWLVPACIVLAAAVTALAAWWVSTRLRTAQAPPPVLQATSAVPASATREAQLLVSPTARVAVQAPTSENAPVPTAWAATATSPTAAASMGSGSTAISAENAGQVARSGLYEERAGEFAWIPGGKALLIAGYPLRLFDPETGQAREISTSSPASQLAFSADGAVLASARTDGVVLWDVVSWSELRTLPGSKDTRQLALLPDGNTLVTAAGNALKVWDLSRDVELRTIATGGYVDAVAFSPDGQAVASATSDGKIKLWNPADGSERGTLSGHSRGVPSLSFSPDGSRLASGSADGTIRIWDLATGRTLQTLVGHSGEVNHVAFSPDGKLLASGSDDLTVRIWDAASGKELRSLTGHTNGVNWVAFSRDGATLATGGDDGLRLWNITP